MKKHITLSIPDPCQEKWNNFLPTSQGGYCLNCKKEVIDFTHWSDRQIKDYFKDRNETACGRFRKDQLKLYSLNSTPGYPYRFLPLSLFGLTLFVTAHQAEATEKKIPDVHTISLEKILESNEIAGADTTGRKTITGIINAEDDQSPLPGVNIVLKNTTIHTVSDGNGKFSLEIPDPKDSDILVFSFIGYEIMEKSITGTSELSITLKPDQVALGEMVVVLGGVCAKRWTPRGVWWRIKNIFR